MWKLFKRIYDNFFVDSFILVYTRLIAYGTTGFACGLAARNAFAAACRVGFNQNFARNCFYMFHIVPPITFILLLYIT